MTSPLINSDLPLPLLRQGKVREVYQVDEQRLLLVASDRVSAYDVVLDRPIPHKGRVLTQLSAHWFGRLAHIFPSHFITADIDEIVSLVPRLAAHREQLDGRSTLVRRTEPVVFECVVRGYLAGSAWQEYRRLGTLAAEPLPQGMLESSRFVTPVFSPATKALTGHDENISFDVMRRELGDDLALLLRDASFAIYAAGRHDALEQGLIIADTKFEFGIDSEGKVILIDEVLTPDSSRFWPSDGYSPGKTQPSFDKQPIRDWLQGEREAGRWNGEHPAPEVPDAIVEAATARYLDAFRRLTGHDLTMVPQ